MCSIARYLGYRFTMGSHPVPDYRRSACIVVWGANPPASQPNVAHAIAVARRRGAALVVVDPRSSTISRGATIHAGVRPGTDGALAWALVHELIAAGAYDKASVVRRSMGFEEAAEYARSFTPRRAEEETGVPAEVVREIAALLADSAPRVAQCTGNGLDHHRNGVDAVRAIALLDGLLGTIGEPGGSRPAGLPPLRSLALHDALPLDHLSPLGADRFPVLYSERHECHTMTAVDAMLEGRPYPLRALLVTAANPALTNPYSARVRRALGALDLLVVRDLFMTETAAAAHYVLPAASFLERSELHFHVETQTLTLTEAVLRLPEVQTEYEFWRGLARRLGAGSLFPWEDERALNAWLLEPTGLALDDLERDRTGVPCRVVPAGDGSAPLDTPSGKFEFVSRRLGEMGYAALPAYRRPSISNGRITAARLSPSRGREAGVRRQQVQEPRFAASPGRRSPPGAPPGQRRRARRW